MRINMSDQIKLFQTDRVWKQIGTEVLDLVNQYHQRGQAQNGDITNQLETVLSQRFGRKHCITTACGTDALDIALQALSLPANSAIAVSNYTFTASAHAIARSGHRVVPVDVVENYCMDPDKIESAAAMVTVDLFGNISNYQRLEESGIPIVVDAAQSLESMDQHGVWSAQRGIASCLSFSPSKTISSWGSGGAVLTDNDDIAYKCKKLRLHGKTKNSDVSIAPGLNSMMSTLESAAVLVGLRYADQWQSRRKQIAEYLIEQSNHASAMDLDVKKHTFSKLVFQSSQRDAIIKRLHSQNVDCVVHYTRLINDEPIYTNNQHYKVSEHLKSLSFTVPNQHTLTDSEVEIIAQGLK